MKKLLVSSIAALGLIGTHAFAADMAVKAPPAAPAPVYNWTGWYAGVNAGASFGNVKTDFNGTPIFFEGVFPVQITPGFEFSDRSAPSGFIGGGQIGYNWQFSPVWVVGLEADIQGALERESNNLSNPFSIATGVLAPVTGTAVTSYTTKIEWFGTARLRAGYVWGDGNVMSYLTGGLAYGKVVLEGTNNLSGTFTEPVNGTEPFAISHAFGHSHVNTGWVVGYGTEGKLLIPGWTYRIEGLYMDLGHLDATGGVAVVPSSSFTVSGGQVTTHSHFTDGILRGGLNYKFY